MKLVIDTNLKENIYTTTVDVKDVRPEDTELFSDYGEQRVDVSAEITKSVTEDVKSTVEVEQPKLDDDGNEQVDGEGNTIMETVTKEVITKVNRDVLLVNEGTKYKYILSDFPISRSFAVTQYGEDAEFIATEYGKLIETRVKEIVDKLKSKPDNFSGTREVIL